MAGIYLHIPFCKKACIYCNFHFSTSLKLKNVVINAMQKEIEMQRDFLPSKKIETIYFGGGTPSLLTYDEIRFLTDTIHKNFNTESIIEFTLEANPDDLTAKYLNDLKKTEINRLSIGVQSFHQADLDYLQRVHNSKQAEFAIKASQDAGFTNINADLIYGIPEMSKSAWKQNIEKLKEFKVPHFSAYSLTVENKTALHHAIKTNKIALPNDETSVYHFEYLLEQAYLFGYENYEISNFALPGNHAIHNTNYWNGIPYLGIGPGAHSFNGKVRRWNIANNALYANNLLEKNQLTAEEEILSPINIVNEYIMTSLRTMWGLDLQKVGREWDLEFAIKIENSAIKFIEQKLMIKDKNFLKLTNKGKLFADKIASEMFL